MSVSQAQDTLSLDLKQCRLMAIENSERIKIAETTLEKAGYEKAAARSAWLPNISASVLGMYSKTEINQQIYLPVYNFDIATGELVPDLAINPLDGQPIMGSDGNPVFNTYAYLPLDFSLNGGLLASLRAEQPLYAGGKIITGNRMAALGYEMAQLNTELNRHQVLYEADQAYYTYISVAEKLKLAEKYCTLLKQLVAMVEDSYNTGMTNRNELLKVQVQLNEALLQAQKARSGLELSRMAICRLTGSDFSTPLMINDSIRVGLPINTALLPPDATNRYEYRLLEQKTVLADMNIKMILGDYLPAAGISLGYNYYNINLSGMDNYDSDGINAIASISIPITKFGEGRAKIKSARADREIAQMELEKTEKLLQLDIEQARLNLLDALTRIEISRAAVEQADENVRVSKDNYELGMETLAGMLEAQAGWQKAYSSLIDARADYKIKESYFMKVTNTLKVQ